MPEVAVDEYGEVGLGNEEVGTAGVMTCMKAGVEISSVRRPLAYTKVEVKEKEVREEGDKNETDNIPEQAEEKTDCAEIAA